MALSEIHRLLENINIEEGLLWGSVFLNPWLSRKWRGCLETKGRSSNSRLGGNWSRMFLTSQRRINLNTILLTKYPSSEFKNLLKRVRVCQLVQGTRPKAMLRQSSKER